MMTFNELKQFLINRKFNEKANDNIFRGMSIKQLEELKQFLNVNDTLKISYNPIDNDVKKMKNVTIDCQLTKPINMLSTILSAYGLDEKIDNIDYNNIRYFIKLSLKYQLFTQINVFNINILTKEDESRIAELLSFKSPYFVTQLFFEKNLKLRRFNTYRGIYLDPRDDFWEEEIKQPYVFKRKR